MEKTIYTREYAAALRLLRELRERSGLTQVQVAKKLRVTQSLFSKMERGDRRLDLIEVRTLCRVLGTTLPDFAALLERELGGR